tara:strand:+ start:364 stop:1167 length:804 start_codon:yes stop_codon:yes gene_type:complete
MKLIYIIFILIFNFCTSVSFALNYSIGDRITNILDLNKNFKIKLSEGEWEVVRKEFHSVYTIRQFILGIGKIKNNRVVEIIEVYEGQLQRNVNEIDNIIIEMVFHDKHDGCYDRPEYYVVELYRRGNSHNCMVVRHLDIQKELKTPDSNWGKAAAASYNFWIKNNPEIKIPDIMLNSSHSYFSRLVGGNWMRVDYFLDPDEINSPKLNFLNEETSEFHRSNINRFSEHKKTMERFMFLSSKRHMDFEKTTKSKGTHRLKLSKYLIEQ